ncbi:MAG: hypothetical protein HQL91_06260 [Magnetococcales bacterium]|nr:hypothetical protein [Magnetococcales bacterium]
MLCIYHTHFATPPTGQQWEQLQAPLPPAFVAQTQRFVRWEDRLARLLGRRLLAHGLHAQRGEPPALHAIRQTRFGKPFLDGPVQFNITHSGGVVACALTDAGDIGLDVEQHRAISLDDFHGFVPDPPWLSCADPVAQRIVFFNFWTQRESVLKAEGQGMSIHPKEIRPDHHGAWLNGRFWAIHSLDLHPGYSAHLACVPTPETPRLEFIPLHRLSA